MRPIAISMVVFAVVAAAPELAATDSESACELTQEAGPIIPTISPERAPAGTSAFCPVVLNHHVSTENAHLAYADDGRFGQTWREIDGPRATIGYALLDSTGAIIAGPEVAITQPVRPWSGTAPRGAWPGWSVSEIAGVCFSSVSGPTARRCRHR